MREFIARYIKWSIPVTVLAGMLFSCENDIESIAELSADKSSPFLTSYDANISYTDSGQLMAALKAPQLDQYQNTTEYSVAPKSLELTFFDSIGDPTAVLTGDSGIFHEQMRQLEVFKNVKMYLSDSVIVSTEYIIWIQDSAKVSSHKFVRITRPLDNSILYGYGFEASHDFSDLHIIEPRGKRYINEEQQTTPDNE